MLLFQGGFIWGLVFFSGSDLVPPLCSQAQANCRVGIAALNTLAGYIDWVALSHITADNCKLLEMLCLLLNEPELQVGAAECLLIAVSRKVSSFSLAFLAPFYFFSPIQFFRLSNVIFALSSKNQNSNLADSVNDTWCECHASTIRRATVGTLSKFCACISLQLELGGSH